jgi:hypothetical protein
MYTVIGAFDDRRLAQRTVDALQARGVARNSIHLQFLPGKLPATMPEAATWANDYSDVRREHDEGFLAAVRHLFASLLAADREPHGGSSPGALRRGSTVVTVDNVDPAMADRVVGVLREQGGGRIVRRECAAPVLQLVRQREQRAHVDRLARRADETLQRATGDAHDDEDEAARSAPESPPRYMEPRLKPRRWT